MRGWPSLWIGLSLIVMVGAWAFDAEARESHRVLVLPPFDAELSDRLRGYLADLDWDLSVARPSNAESDPMKLALERAHKADAEVVLWFEWPSPKRLRLRLLDVRQRALLERDVPVEGDDPALARSAAFEAVGLIVGASLEKIEQGRAVGERIDVPSTAPPDDSDSTFVEPRPEEEPSHTSAFVEAGFRAYADSARTRGGPRGALGLRFGAIWLGLEGHRVLPSRVTGNVAPASGAPEGARLELDLAETSIGTLVGYDLPLSSPILLSVAGGPALVIATRSTRPLAQGQQSPASTQLLSELHGHVRLGSPRFWDGGVRVGVELGALVSFRRPKWVVTTADGSDLPLEESWRPVQPSVGVWLGWSPE